MVIKVVQLQIFSGCSCLLNRKIWLCSRSPDKALLFSIDVFDCWTEALSLSVAAVGPFKAKHQYLKWKVYRVEDEGVILGIEGSKSPFFA